MKFYFAFPECLTTSMRPEVPLAVRPHLPPVRLPLPATTNRNHIPHVFFLVLSLSRSFVYCSHDNSTFAEFAGQIIYYCWLSEDFKKRGLWLKKWHPSYLFYLHYSLAGSILCDRGGGVLTFPASPRIFCFDLPKFFNGICNPGAFKTEVA